MNLFTNLPNWLASIESVLIIERLQCLHQTNTQTIMSFNWNYGDHETSISSDSERSVQFSWTKYNYRFYSHTKFHINRINQNQKNYQKQWLVQIWLCQLCYGDLMNQPIAYLVYFFHEILRHLPQDAMTDKYASGKYCVDLWT